MNASGFLIWIIDLDTKCVMCVKDREIESEGTGERERERDQNMHTMHASTWFNAWSAESSN